MSWRDFCRNWICNRWCLRRDEAENVHFFFYYCGSTVFSCISALTSSIWSHFASICQSDHVLSGAKAVSDYSTVFVLIMKNLLFRKKTLVDDAEGDLVRIMKHRESPWKMYKSKSQKKYWWFKISLRVESIMATSNPFSSLYSTDFPHFALDVNENGTDRVVSDEV